MKYPIEIFCQPYNNKHKLLRVNNIHLIHFLSALEACLIEELKIYWLDLEKDFVSSAKPSCPVFDITTCMQGVDVLISTVEIKLSNGFLIDSNIEDKIFCRIPTDCEVSPLSRKIKKSVELNQKDILPNAPKIDWSTIEIKP